MAGPRPRRDGRSDKVKADRLKRQGVLLVICAGLLHLAVLVVDRMLAERLDAFALRDTFYFAGIGISLLMLLGAGVLVWRSIRLRDGPSAG